jgi:futalosine hydrolase
VLVLAAFLPELAALPPDVDVDRATVGVGLVEAALGTSRVLAGKRPDRVVLVGTVGAYPGSGLGPCDVVVAERVLLAAPSGAIVEAMPRSVTADASPFADLRRAVVATTLAVTTDDDVARALEGATGAHVEHLEAFAVARGCAEAGVPFSAVFGVANAVGSRGRAEWRKNHERAAAAACAVIAAVRNRPRPRSPG